MKKILPEKLVKLTKSWLGHDRITYYKTLKIKFGKIDAVWKTQDGKDHVVAQREGQVVKDFIYKQIPIVDGISDWTREDIEDNWVELIDEIIK